jgi:integration host factor subunit beta
MTMSEPQSRTITKRELVNRIAEETDQTKVAVRDVVQRFLDSIVDELSLGNRLEFREFGVFEVRERAARRAQNPKTLEKVDVPAKRVVKFKVGRVMRQRVCDEIGPEEKAAPAPAPEPTAAPAAGRPQPPTPPPTKPGSPF